jgi:hypothetical protein
MCLGVVGVMDRVGGGGEVKQERLCQAVVNDKDRLLKKVRGS